jgi:hypothetical protein
MNIDVKIMGITKAIDVGIAEMVSFVATSVCSERC